MGDELRNIVWRINRLHVLHRIYLSRAALENGLYFGQLPILENIMDHDLCTQIEAQLREVDPRYNAVITVDRGYQVDYGERRE